MDAWEAGEAEGAPPGAVSTLPARRTCERHCFRSFPSTSIGPAELCLDFGIPARLPKCVHSYAAWSFLPPNEGSSRNHAATWPPFGEQLAPQGPCPRCGERMLPKQLPETTTMEPTGRCLLHRTTFCATNQRERV